MFDDCDAFADFLDDFHLMSNHDDCDIQLLIDVFQKLEDGFYSFRIKCACRFIRKQYRGVGYDGSCNADSLLLSAGKLGRILVLVAGKPYKFKDVINPFFCSAFGTLASSSGKATFWATVLLERRLKCWKIIPMFCVLCAARNC